MDESSPGGTKQRHNGGLRGSRWFTRRSDGRVAILVVNGASDLPGAPWLDICLRNVRDLTRYVDYHVYVWNNAVGEDTAPVALEAPTCTVVNADPNESLTHKHAEPLQRLYELARTGGAKYIVTLDTDAFPVREGWLVDLLSALDAGAVLAGVWHAESAIDPYVHPSCLATTTDFLEAHGLRFDYLPIGTPVLYDTASNLTRVALDAGLPVHRLLRSNRNNLHPVIGGVYGDTVYHHGAGSRGANVWWAGESLDAATLRRNRRIQELATAMLVGHRAEYLAWLRGSNLNRRVFLVLGMHRSGTSCLTACLEECGLNLGNVNRRSLDNPTGSHERSSVELLNESILTAAGGTWRQPPARVEADDTVRASIDKEAGDLLKRAPSVLKDPRLLLIHDLWLGSLEDPTLIGTFRHPAAVADSLWHRQQVPANEAYALWANYNRRLVALHRSHSFPLIRFDLSDADRYCSRVTALAAELGLQPSGPSLRRIVEPALDHHRPPAGTPAPHECRELYDYLMENSYQGTAQPGGFFSLLQEWGECLEATMDTRWSERLELWALRQFRRIPYRVRAPLIPPIAWIMSHGGVKSRFSRR